MWFTATTQKSINRLLKNERKLSLNIKKFNKILIFGPATFCLTAMICSKGDFHIAKYSNLPDSYKISNKTFPLSFLSLKSIRNHAVIMYKCSNVKRIITSRIISSFLHNRNFFVNTNC